MSRTGVGGRILAPWLFISLADSIAGNRGRGRTTKARRREGTGRSGYPRPDNRIRGEPAGTDSLFGELPIGVRKSGAGRSLLFDFHRRSRRTAKDGTLGILSLRFSAGFCNNPGPGAVGVHLDRVAGGDRDHRGAGGFVVAGVGRGQLNEPSGGLPGEPPSAPVRLDLEDTRRLAQHGAAWQRVFESRQATLGTSSVPPSDRRTVAPSHGPTRLRAALRRASRPTVRPRGCVTARRRARWGH